MTGRWTSGKQKETAVHVLKANNKFLLISFDKLQSDFIFFRNQTKTLMEELEMNQSSTVICFVNGDCED